MINFACKRFDLKEVIRCSFNTTKKELEIMLYLIENFNKEFTAKEISEYFKIGLSTSQKAIKNLNKKELVQRRQKNIDKGGYVFVYYIKEKSFLKQKILETMNRLTKEIENEIRRL
jgi:predicted transcriptional regulator